MPVSVGDKLGPYEILALIGKGGMGEVYRARDPRLNRDVAIKVSAAQFSERFEREAKAIGALNHPNICTLYDVGPNYLVMEYVEGTPLKGPLPVDQALKYAVQICDALDAAHKKGITHRDLKPANILVTKQGVKLLDFGLAKFDNPVAVGQETMTMGLTAKGQILGTLLYMSPEQINGQEAGPQSDIFSFGLVLYEILTGKRAFEGSTPASVMGAILERPAPSVSDVATPALDRVLKRCLEKDPESRWQSARDLKAALELVGPASGPINAQSDIREVRAGGPNYMRERVAWLTLAAALLGAIVFLGLRLGRAQTTAELVRFAVYPPERAVLPGGLNNTVGVPQFAVSPDGRNLAFVSDVPGAKPMIWVRTLDQVTPQPLAGTESGEYPFWSADNAWVGFFAQGELRKIRAAGGPVQVVANDVKDPRGGSWGADGTILIGSASGGILRVPSSGGAATLVTKLDVAGKEASHRWPHFLPDSRHFLFTVRAGDQDRRGVFIDSVDGGMKRLLVHSDTPAIYASGVLLFADGSTLMGRAFDTDRLSLGGQPFVVVERIGRASNGYAAFSAASTGVLAHATANSEAGRIAWFDRAGNVQGYVSPEGDYTDIRLSPDEKHLLTSLVDPRSGNPDIWLTELARGSPSRFTFGPALNSGPLWSPDGQRIVFRTTRNGGLVEFYEKSAGGGGKEGPVLLESAQRAAGAESVNLVLAGWSPDGRDLLYSVLVSPGFQLWRLPLDTRKPVRLTDQNIGMHASLSPDGRFISYTSDESGRTETYVQTYPLTDRKWPVSTGGGYEPLWRGDGLEIYYLSADRKLMAAAVGPGPSFGVPKALFQTRVAETVTGYRTHYVPARDGQRFLIITRTTDPPQASITVVVNWQAGLKK